MLSNCPFYFLMGSQLPLLVAYDEVPLRVLRQREEVPAETIWRTSKLCTANVIPEPSCCEATVRLVHYPQMLTTTGNLSGIFFSTNSM